MYTYARIWVILEYMLCFLTTRLEILSLLHLSLKQDEKQNTIFRSMRNNSISLRVFFHQRDSPEYKTPIADDDNRPHTCKIIHI